jgi:hypothetical protein
MWFIPRSKDFITEGVEIEALGDILSLHVKRNLDKPWNIIIKSLFEKTLMVIFLLLTSPVFALIPVSLGWDRSPISSPKLVQASPDHGR